VRFEAACNVAVRQRGVHQVIVSQSAKPVRAVGALTISPTISASHHPFVRFGSSTPNAAKTPRAADAVYAPIVTSVSGG
jgi:hypothetical protein